MKAVIGTIGSGTLKDHFEDTEIIDALKSTYLVNNDDTTSDSNATSSSYWPFTRNVSKRLLMTNPDERKLHPLTVGLVIKLRNGLLRITRRTRLKVIQPPHDTTEDRLYRLVLAFIQLQQVEKFRQCWTKESLWNMAIELSSKSVYLSPALAEEFFMQPLVTTRVLSHIPTSSSSLSMADATNNNDIGSSSSSGHSGHALVLNTDFLRRVAEYHAGVSRPIGTFTVNGLIDVDVRCVPPITTPSDLNVKLRDDIDDLGGMVETHCEVKDSLKNDHKNSFQQQGMGLDKDTDKKYKDDSEEEEEDAAILMSLAAATREKCPSCGGRRQVYCGDCHGLRMPMGESLLPPRIHLPFDVLLVLHWQEKLHHCTGIQCSALVTPGTVEVFKWPRAVLKEKKGQRSIAGHGVHKPFSTTHHEEEDGGDGGSLVDNDNDENNDDNNDENNDDENNDEDNNDAMTEHPHPPPPKTLSRPPPLSSRPLEDLLYGIDHLQDVDTQWGNFVASLDPNRDVILFPGVKAISANEFPWKGKVIPTTTATTTPAATTTTTTTTNDPSLSSSSSSSSSTRWRLVVLESNWLNGKTIFNQMNKYREIKQLLPLRTVILHDIQGQYWRFHEEGLSSVSTIEAIAYTAHAAGLDHTSFHHLLLLFRLQKLRVLDRVRQGGKAPKAVKVSGNGLGSWEHLTNTVTERGQI